MRKSRNYWNKERAYNKALLFDNKRDFKKKYIAAYELLRKNGLLKDACKHMENIAHPIKWTYIKCKNEALKCKTKNEFKKKCSWGYLIAKQNDWFDEITKHFVVKKKNVIQTKKKCFEEALKYNTRTTFARNSQRAYDNLRRNDLLNDACKHMKNTFELKLKWNKNECKKIALK